MGGWLFTHTIHSKQELTISSMNMAAVVRPAHAIDCKRAAVIAYKELEARRSEWLERGLQIVCHAPFVARADEATARSLRRLRGDGDV